MLVPSQGHFPRQTALLFSQLTIIPKQEMLPSWESAGRTGTHSGASNAASQAGSTSSQATSASSSLTGRSSQGSSTVSQANSTASQGNSTSSQQGVTMGQAGTQSQIDSAPPQAATVTSPTEARSPHAGTPSPRSSKHSPSQ